MQFNFSQSFSDIVKKDILLSETICLEGRALPDETARPGASFWHSCLWKFSVGLAHSGDSWVWLVGLVLVWFFGDAYWRYRAVVLAASLVIQSIAVLLIKLLVRRQRPPGEWGGIYRSTDPHSFPSGHSARAALIAVMICGMGPAWLGWLLLLWSVGVSISRVLTGVHYISDIIVGFIVGILLGWGLLEFAPALVDMLPFLFF